MKKKVFLSYWYYFLGGIILSAVSVGAVIVLLVSLICIPVERNPTVSALYWGLPLMFICAVFMVFMMGKNMFQYTVMTEESITAKCLWGTIRKLKWDEVKEVRYEKFYVSVQGAFKCGWYVFDDGEERQQRNGLIRKNSHITLPATKRTQKAIAEFWKGEIKEKTII